MSIWSNEIKYAHIDKTFDENEMNPEVHDGWLKLRFSTSEKDMDGKRIYSHWTGVARGKAYDALKDVKPGDSVNLSKVKMGMRSRTGQDGRKRKELSINIYDESVNPPYGSTEKPPAKSNPSTTAPVDNTDTEEPW